ncbi:MAG TPA: peptide chain release factor 2 [Terriglobales bacterium]|nr:peptide chain release factor 2 [Terriglobales bacterium]
MAGGALAIIEAWIWTSCSANTRGWPPRPTTSGCIFDPPTLKRQLGDLDQQAAAPNFWSDPAQSQAVNRARKRVQELLDDDQRLARTLEDLGALFELGREGEAVEPEIERELGLLQAALDDIETRTLLGNENDALNAILTIHPGAGGTESQDWAEMLLRMYTRWAERHGFKTTLNDRQEGEEAGIKSATVTIEGEYAYGLLQSETGVHRLVRISPFDQAKRRHTSFASVFVSPEIDDRIEINIRDEDLRIDTFRAGGKGGQHVNMTDSAVRIVHLPTNIVVQCQNERSQHKNKDMAMKILRSRLYEHELEKKRAAARKVEDSKLDIDFGSQIRSYVMQPYQMVKDTRTKLEIGDVNRVLDGDLDKLQHGWLVERRRTSAAVA